MPTDRTAVNPHITQLAIAAAVCAVVGVIFLIAAIFVAWTAAAITTGGALLGTAFWLWVVVTLFAAWQHENDMTRAGARSTPSDR